MFGWASIQLDGGIAAAGNRVREWFATTAIPEKSAASLAIGFVAAENISSRDLEAINAVRDFLLEEGATVVLAGEGLAPKGTEPTLSYGQKFLEGGLHLMDAPTPHLVEIITGMAATGVEVVFVYSNSVLVQGNPLVPVLQVAGVDCSLPEHELDLRLPVEPAEVLKLAVKAAAGRLQPSCERLGNISFQMSRGRFGISL
jgi:hypothetical protein